MADEEDTYRNDHRLNSRPLDVHRWSDHPEVKQLINQLWSVLPFFRNKGKGYHAFYHPTAIVLDSILWS